MAEHVSEGADHAGEVGEAAGHATEAVGMPQIDFTSFPNQIFWLVITLVLIYSGAVAGGVAAHRGGSGRASRHDYQ